MSLLGFFKGKAAPSEPPKPAAHDGRVRLLKNVVEEGGIKLTRRRRQPDGTYAVEVPWVKGAVIQLSLASAQKYVDAGVAEWVNE